MAIERERGISVVTSVMTFDYDGRVFNLLDTPGHEDFSEDTYRTLTAVDSAVMVIDAAKGIEARTRKLFEVCRLRDIPIITFINKMDRESRDPFDLLDEIEKTLALDTAPMTWPIGRGRDFAGTLRHRHRRDAAVERGRQDRRAAAARSRGAGAEKSHARCQGDRRGTGAGEGRLPALRFRLLPRGPPDAGVLRLGLEEFRRQGPARRARRLRAAAARASRRTSAPSTRTKAP